MNKHLIEVKNNGQVEETVDFSETNHNYYDVMETLRRNSYPGDIIYLYRVDDDTKTLIESIDVDAL